MPSPELRRISEREMQLAPFDSPTGVGAGEAVFVVADRRWRVDVAFLDEWHCAAVCRGPPSDGLLPFFAAPGAGRDGGPAWMKVLDEARPPFKLVGL